METDQEREFVRRARTGDRAAFAVLVDRYWRPVRAWLAGLTGQDDVAEDLAQETFLKAWISLPSLVAEETFRVWLFRIAHNEFLTLHRSAQSRPQGSPPESVDPRPGPEVLAEESEGAAALRREIERLPTIYREAYLLWTHEQLPYSEIARVLDITEEVARWRVCQARRQLARILERFLNPPN